MKSRRIYAILHNVRSLHNVGSVFRTADGAGITKLYLAGYTPSPVDEMGKPRREMQKTALGAERVVVWERVRNITRLIERLAREGVDIVALEMAKGAVDYRAFKARGPVALLLGNEVRGLSPTLLRRCRSALCIPMRGAKESLNVAVAFGIAAYAITDTKRRR